MRTLRKFFLLALALLPGLAVAQLWTVNLGTAPTGAGGDTPRVAFTKVNSNTVIFAAGKMAVSGGTNAAFTGATNFGTTRFITTNVENGSLHVTLTGRVDGGGLHFDFVGPDVGVNNYLEARSASNGFSLILAGAGQPINAHDRYTVHAFDSFPLGSQPQGADIRTQIQIPPYMHYRQTLSARSNIWHKFQANADDGGSLFNSTADNRLQAWGHLYGAGGGTFLGVLETTGTVATVQYADRTLGPDAFGQVYRSDGLAHRWDTGYGGNWETFNAALALYTNKASIIYFPIAQIGLGAPGSGGITVSNHTNGLTLRGAGTAAGSGLTIATNGNVGIGIATPANSLQVAGNLSLSSGALVGFNGNVAVDSSKAAIYGDGSTTMLNAPTSGGSIFLGVNGVAKLTVVGNNLGVGTTTPRDKLEVSGGGIIVTNTGEGLRLGPGGASLTNILYASASLDFPSVLGGTNTPAQRISVPGAAIGDIVDLGYIKQRIAGGDTGSESYSAYASNDTVYVFAINLTSGTFDLTNQVFKVSVQKFK